MPRLKNHRREKFCKLYVNQCDYNGAKAARGAGFSEATAKEQASQLLTQSEVQQRVAELMEKADIEFDMSAEEAKAETAAMARFNMADLYDDQGQLIPIHELPREVTACITEVEYDRLGLRIPTKVKAGKDKKSALDQVHRIHNNYEADNKGFGEIHIHLDEKDMKA